MELEGSTIRIDLAPLSGLRRLVGVFAGQLVVTAKRTLQDRPLDLIVLVLLILAYLLPSI